MKKAANGPCIFHIRLIAVLLVGCMMIGSITALTAQAFWEESALPSFEYLNRDHGLSNLSVSSMIEDRNGFLWFGTQGGLNRFDGRYMHVTRHNPFDDEGLVHNLIQTMYYDEVLHELWIGTYQGISRLLIEENTFINYTVEDDGLSNPVVIAIHPDHQGDMWVGTMKGLNRINPQTGTLKQYDVPGDVVRALHVDTGNRLLVGSYEGLLYYDPVTDSIEAFELELPTSFVMTIQEENPGMLTLGLWDGGVAVVNLETGNVEAITYEDNRVYAMTTTRDGTRWVGTWGGGLYAEMPDGRSYHFSGEGEGQILPHSVVYSLLEDHSGILWIGTNGGGLSKVNPRKTNYVRFTNDPENSQSLSAGKINAVVKDQSDQLWISVYNNGVERYDPETDTMVKYRHDPENPQSLPSDSVVTILSTDEGQLLLGTGAGVVTYHPETDTFSQLAELPEDVIVYALAQQENYLWIGTYTHGVFKYHLTTGSLTQFEHTGQGDSSLSDNLIYAIHVDGKNRVWVGTNNGLNILEPGSDRFRTHQRLAGDKTQLASNTIRTILEDDQGQIWVGTVGGGIARYNETTDTFSTYIEEDGLSSNVVTGMLVGDDGRLWIGTHSGISVFDPETEDFLILTPDDGIGGWEFNSGHYKDDNGDLYFGGVHGITVISGMKDQGPSVIPPVYITGIDLFQNPYQPERMFFNDETLYFGPQETFLSFRFAALDYDAPDKVRFSHFLEGFDQEWIHAGTRDYATYSNLPPGEYRLLVKAETVRGAVTEPAMVSFVIATPWYRSSLAYVGYGVLIIALFVILLQIRESRLVGRRNETLAAMNLKLEEANRQLEHLSTRDPLTGLYNRRYFNTMMEEHLQLAKRSQVPFSLLMFDIDHFKEINDRFGHVIGDKVLVTVGQAAMGVLPRTTDFIARFGGDEYVVVLYDTGQEGALQVAQSIKEAIENSHAMKAFLDDSFHMTTSLGVVSIVPDKEMTAEKLLQEADRTLYLAKEQGRNRICLSWEMEEDQQ